MQAKLVEWCMRRAWPGNAQRTQLHREMKRWGIERRRDARRDDPHLKRPEKMARCVIVTITAQYFVYTVRDGGNE